MNPQPAHPTPPTVRSRHLSAMTGLLVVSLLLGAVGLAGCSDGKESSIATTRISIDFAGLRDSIAADVTVDLDSRPTEAAYATDGLARRDYFTVHDQLDVWSQDSGVAYEVTPYKQASGEGYFLDSIDGYPADAQADGYYWSLMVNDTFGSGMSDDRVWPGSHIAWKLTALQLDDSALSSEAPEPAQDAPITVRGTAPPGSALSFAVLDGTSRSAATGTVDGGAWQVTVDAPAGRSELEVIADSGTGAQRLLVPLVRLVPVTLSFDYGPDLEHEDTSDTVWFDLEGHAAAPAYLQEGTEHPPIANVHDVLVTWEAATGSVIDYGYDPDFQSFSVLYVNGAGNSLDSSLPPWWCYTVDDASADGISIQDVQPGATIAFSLGTCTGI